MGVLREYHAAMGKLILAHEGTLERFTGDGMMIFFNVRCLWRTRQSGRFEWRLYARERGGTDDKVAEARL